MCVRQQENSSQIQILSEQCEFTAIATHTLMKTETKTKQCFTNLADPSTCIKYAIELCGGGNDSVSLCTYMKMDL